MFALDRVSKLYVMNFFLSYSEQSYYLFPFLNLTLIWNTGMAFGLFSSESYIYQIISIIIFFVITCLVIWLYRSNSILEKTSLSLIIGGAFGNLFDRIVYSSVPDFIDLNYNGFHWFIFNVADIFITLGVICLILDEILFKKYRYENNN